MSLFCQENEHRASDLRIRCDIIYKGFVIDIKKNTGPNFEPFGTPNVMFWNWRTAIFDFDVLFHIAQIRLKPALHDMHLYGGHLDYAGPYSSICHDWLYRMLLRDLAIAH